MKVEWTVSNVKINSNRVMLTFFFFFMISIQVSGQEKDTTLHSRQDKTGDINKVVSRDAKEIIDKTWQWVSTVTPVESVKVVDSERYTIKLTEDGNARMKFDCNHGSAGYTISEGKLNFGPMVSTRMACPEDSQDALFMRDLQRVSTFFMEEGDLYLELPYDSGTMHFQILNGDKE